MAPIVAMGAVVVATTTTKAAAHDHSGMPVGAGVKPKSRSRPTTIGILTRHLLTPITPILTLMMPEATKTPTVAGQMLLQVESPMVAEEEAEAEVVAVAVAAAATIRVRAGVLRRLQ